VSQQLVYLTRHYSINGRQLVGLLHITFINMLANHCACACSYCFLESSSITASRVIRATKKNNYLCKFRRQHKAAISTGLFYFGPMRPVPTAEDIALMLLIWRSAAKQVDTKCPFTYPTRLAFLIRCRCESGLVKTE